MISQQRPTCVKPANRNKSTVASVWPFRSRTPPAFAVSGNICPGRRKSAGQEFWSAAIRAVNPRSTAEIPVVVSTWSIETVKAVSWLSVLCCTICDKPNRSTFAALIGIQIKPFAADAMRLTFSVVANCPAQIKSPSFSRSGSSVTRIHFPARSASKASSMVW